MISCEIFEQSLFLDLIPYMYVRSLYLKAKALLLHTVAIDVKGKLKCYYLCDHHHALTHATTFPRVVQSLHSISVLLAIA